MTELMTSAERCFGDTRTVEEVSRCLREAGERLLKLKSEVLQEIEKRVPGSWDGDAAQTFKVLMDEQMDAVAQLADGACLASQALKTLEVGLAAAKAKFQAAQAHAASQECGIDAALIVEPFDKTSEAGWIAARAIQENEVDVAIAMADRARADATAHLERLDGACWAFYDAIFPQAPMTAPGARRAARPRRPRTPRPPHPPGTGWQQYEREIEQQKQRMWERLERMRNPQYRRELEKTHGPPPNDGRTYEAHHNFPVENSREFGQVGIDTKNPAWGSWVESGAHKQFSDQFRADWNSFWRNNPGATRDEVFGFGRTLANKYGYTPPF